MALAGLERKDDGTKAESKRVKNVREMERDMHVGENRGRRQGSGGRKGEQDKDEDEQRSFIL